MVQPTSFGDCEVLTPADPFYHIPKNDFTIPFVCGCTNLGEAVRRVVEGAAMIRTKGEAGTGNVVAAMKHARLIDQEIRQVQSLDDAGLDAAAEHIMDRYRILAHSSEMPGESWVTPFGNIDEEMHGQLRDILDLWKMNVLV